MQAVIVFAGVEVKVCVGVCVISTWQIYLKAETLPAPSHRLALTHTGLFCQTQIVPVAALIDSGAKEMYCAGALGKEGPWDHQSQTVACAASICVPTHSPLLECCSRAWKEFVLFLLGIWQYWPRRILLQSLIYSRWLPWLNLVTIVVPLRFWNNYNLSYYVTWFFFFFLKIASIRC